MRFLLGIGQVVELYDWEIPKCQHLCGKADVARSRRARKTELKKSDLPGPDVGCM